MPGQNSFDRANVNKHFRFSNFTAQFVQIISASVLKKKKKRRREMQLSFRQCFVCFASGCGTPRPVPGGAERDRPEPGVTPRE